MSARHRKQINIMRVIQGRILRGVYTDKIPGERELAKELQTSSLTVNVAIAKLESLGMVRRVARRGTFVTGRSTRQDACRHLFARLAMSISFDEGGHGAFWGEAMIYGFQKAAHERNLHMELVYSEDVDALVAESVEEARGDMCIGTCLLGVPLETRHIVQLGDAAGPIVVADYEMEEPLVPSLTFDNRNAGHLVGRHLVELGHRVIALASDYGVGRNQRQRLAGTREWVERTGGTIATDELGLGESNLDYLRRLFNHPLRPTAIVCSSISMARVFCKYADATGVKIPEEVSVASFGDGIAQLSGGVTHTELDNVGFGGQSLEMLFDEELQANPRREFFPVTLAKDTSTGPAPQR